MNVLLPFALHVATGRIVSVSEVPRGIACDCVCPECRRQVVAKQGDVNAHHFAHVGAIDGSDGLPACAHPVETATHLRAKWVIENAMWVQTPEWTWRGSILIKSIRFTATRVTVDNQYVGPIKPDLIFYHNDRTLGIEIKVWHASDEDKLATLPALGLPSIEIDLSNMEAAKEHQYVLSEAPRRWLYNPRADAILAEMERRAASEEMEKASSWSRRLELLEESLKQREKDLCSEEQLLSLRAARLNDEIDRTVEAHVSTRLEGIARLEAEAKYETSRALAERERLRAKESDLESGIARRVHDETVGPVYEAAIARAKYEEELKKLKQREEFLESDYRKKIARLERSFGCVIQG